MKEKIRYIGILGILGAGLLCVLTQFSGISHAGLYNGVTDSKHDFSATGDDLGQGQLKFYTQQICVFCHTPHGANDQVRELTGYLSGAGSYYNTSGAYGTTGQPLLLWNRDLSNAPQYNGYELYTSSTMDATVDEVRVYSLMCMSCHDGASAINVMTNPPNIGADPVYEQFDSNGYPLPKGSFTMIGEVCNDLFPCSPNPNVGERDPSGPDTGLVQLSNDHPISFDYTAGLVANDTGLVSPSGGVVGTGNLRLFPSPSTGQNTSMECSTCHNPHNQGGTANNNDAYYPFLAMPITGSALCTNCHIK